MKVNNLDLQNLSNLLSDLQERAAEREKERGSFLSRSLPLSERIFLVDTRESNPYYFHKSYRKCLSEGDYSLDGYEGLAVIERKEKNDLINTLIRGKERFQNELQRLQKYEAKCVLVECPYSDLLAGNYTSQILPQSAVGLLHSASYHNSIPFYFVDNFEMANRYTQKYLLCYARKKENNYSFPAPKRAIELRLEDTVLSYSLSSFIKEITVNKVDFRYYINQLKSYPSSAILLECSYSDVVKDSNTENVIFSLIIDHGINVYFMETKEIANKWKESHLKRFRPIQTKPIKSKKKDK